LKLDKKFVVVEHGSFAHSILWISSSLSTQPGQSGGFSANGGGLGRRRDGAGTRTRPESAFFFSKRLQERRVPIRSRSTRFFDRTAAFGMTPQVYKQKLVYRMMIVVNGGTLLWISRVLSTTSIVYGSHKPVGWSCMCLEAKLDKNRACAKNRVSPHSVPVDIHTFIHSPAASFELIIW
jgi:hypothetical protein